MPLWPTVFGINLWLVALVVPLGLGRGGSSLPLLIATPLPLLLLFLGWRAPERRWAQFALLLGVPLLTLLPSAEGTLAKSHLQPRGALGLGLVLLFGYLYTTCASLTDGRPRKTAPAAAPTDSLTSDGSEPAMGTPLAWQAQPLPTTELMPGGRTPARLYPAYALVAVTVAFPAVLLYAIDLHAPHLRALRAAFENRVPAVQASLAAAIALLYSVTLHFCIMAPLRDHLEGDRLLKRSLASSRRAARRGRPRLGFYAGMLISLVGMGLLIWWSL